MDGTERLGKGLHNEVLVYALKRTAASIMEKKINKDRRHFFDDQEEMVFDTAFYPQV